MGLNGSATHPRASQALSSMLSRNALNPADITNLYKMYSAPDPPPVELIRIPQFMGTNTLITSEISYYNRFHSSFTELLLDSLFKPGVKLNPEHKSKYNYLLAYAASVAEVYKKNQRKSMNRDELKATMQVLSLFICCNGLFKDIRSLLRLLRRLIKSVRRLRVRQSW